MMGGWALRFLPSPIFAAPSIIAKVLDNITLYVGGNGSEIGVIIICSVCLHWSEIDVFILCLAKKQPW
jgi:hypothetical protein